MWSQSFDKYQVNEPMTQYNWNNQLILYLGTSAHMVSIRGSVMAEQLIQTVNYTALSDTSSRENGCYWRKEAFRDGQQFKTFSIRSHQFSWIKVNILFSYSMERSGFQLSCKIGYYECFCLGWWTAFFSYLNPILKIDSNSLGKMCWEVTYILSLYVSEWDCQVKYLVNMIKM